MISLSFLKKLCLLVLGICYGYLKSTCLCMEYPLAIFLNFQTNISKGFILWISQSQRLCQDILGISSFHSTTGPCRFGSLAAPSDPGCHGLLCCTLYHCYAQILRRSHRQAPQTRFVPPKMLQPVVHLVDVASFLAQRVGCICQPMWELAAPVLTKLVWDGRSRVA